MNESELKEKYMNYSDEDLEYALKKDISEEEREYIKKLLEKRKEEFEHFNSSPVNNNVAIVFDIDETLVCRGRLAKSNQQELPESNFVLARPGLFELLDGLKELKRKYEQENPGKEFNVYIFTSASKNGSDAFKNFLGEEYCTLFKEFFHRDSDIYDNAKNIHLLPEDTILYFADVGDAGNAFGHSSSQVRENQRIITFDITPFRPDGFKTSITYREYNRHLHNKIQEMLKENHPNAIQYKTMLDELSDELLNYFDEINKHDRIDVLLDHINSQLLGQNTDTVRLIAGNSANKKIVIPSISNYRTDLYEKYTLLFKQIYGEHATTKMNEINNAISPIASIRPSESNPYENSENRAKYHPAEIYPHSKRYMNNDFGEIE